ncbi:MAG: FtsW/RodA/SpoVE family cell cycle protein [Planctomycetota bacterium]
MSDAKTLPPEHQSGPSQDGPPPAAKKATPTPDPTLRTVKRKPLTLAHAGWLVVGATLILVAIGVYCISITSGLEGGRLSGTALRQAVFACLGLAVAIVAMIPHYRRLIHYVVPLAVIVVAMLIFLLIPFVPEAIVRPRNGARRWIDIGITEFQPSEVAKVVYVLVTAAYLRYRHNHRSIRGLVGPSLIAFVPMALILVEPDLGTALLFIPALIAMLIAAGARLSHLISAGVLSLAFGTVVLVTSLVLAQQDSYPLMRPHQVERVQAVMDRFKGDDRFDHERGFQGEQATTLIGAGGIAGHPEAKSRALVYFSSLPERHNDMIFAVFANRFGMLGIVGLLAVYAAWIGGALAIAGGCKDPFGRLVCVGFAAIVATQMGVNIGMTVGLLPITGMTLPFVSYGGSSLLIGFVMVGLICNIAIRRPQYLWRRSFEFDDELAR